MKAVTALCLLAAFASCASAQIDASKFADDFRAKYGPPLVREIFTARNGIEMTVDYAANGHICRIEMAAVAVGNDPGVKTPQAVDEFLLELIPMTLRGKELERRVVVVGAPWLSFTEYEKVTISEAWQESRRTGMSVSFNEMAAQNSGGFVWSALECTQ